MPHYDQYSSVHRSPKKKNWKQLLETGFLYSLLKTSSLLLLRVLNCGNESNFKLSFIFSAHYRFKGDIDAFWKEMSEKYLQQITYKTSCSWDDNEVVTSTVQLGLRENLILGWDKNNLIFGIEA